MGNRAVITTPYNYNHNGVGVYLHWNGGRDSVEAFLKYMELRGFRSPSWNASYAWARLAQVIGNFFGSGLSVGVDSVDNLDTDGDNGVYLIEGWKIVGRQNYEGPEQSYYKLEEMLEAIDQSQPVSERLGEDFLHAEIRPTERLRVGDDVFIPAHDGEPPKCFRVAGFCPDSTDLIHGRSLSGIPYVDQWDQGKDAWQNPNNRLVLESYRVIPVCAEEETAADFGGLTDSLFL